MAVVRSRVSRFFSIALLLLAGSVEPAWEFGHAVIHADPLDHSHETSVAPVSADPTLPSVAGRTEDDGHFHPTFQAPARPASDLPSAVGALRSTIVKTVFTNLAVRSYAFFDDSAIANPRTTHTTQPRAPPLV